MDRNPLVATARTIAFDEALLLIRAEYGEAPGLRLTPSQAQRLCGLEPVLCGAALDALVTARYLDRTAEGLFVRSADHG